MSELDIIVNQFSAGNGLVYISYHIDKSLYIISEKIEALLGSMFSRIINFVSIRIIMVLFQNFLKGGKETIPTRIHEKNHGWPN